ncbi:uncharacterized protein L203_104734 [Cryptococcus depauperatus CBS 7841]|uniref:Uncharacterized protein n=1 Tax=Cryptococcus depauperatus CBS 7841 TaxID=1295531 RepID=A0AAJ8JWB1_9TREE
MHPLAANLWRHSSSVEATTPRRTFCEDDVELDTNKTLHAGFFASTLKILDQKPPSRLAQTERIYRTLR